MASFPRKLRSTKVRPQYVRPFDRADWAVVMLGERVIARGMIIDIVTQEDGDAFAWLLTGPGTAQFYPLWQLIPDGFTRLTFRHLLFSVLKRFNKELALR